MRSSSLSRLLIGGIAATTLSLAGCASTSGAPASDDDSGLVKVVASTNVYGDIASKIGGDLVEVTSIVTGATQDPHSYEATAQDQLTLSKADLVIENGGGYDPFIDTMIEASGSDSVVVVSASDSSGLLEGEGDDHSHEGDHAEGDAHAEEGDSHDHIEGFNEHVWYSFHGVEKVAEEIAHQLGTIDEANASTYDDNYTAFAEEIAALNDQADGMRAQTEGKGVAITEPVPLYLLDEVGLTNKTPGEFSEAVEEGTDVPPAVLKQTLGLFADDAVAFLAYNEQTEGPITEQVRTASEKAGIPVVSFTETLPEGDDYLSWMQSNLDAVAKAVA